MSVQATKTDYYAILQINRTATTKQICQAYKDIALKFHPSLHHINKNQAYRIFCEASEAFDILYDKQKRSIYDEYGEHHLKLGIRKQGEIIGKYKLTSDPEEIFERFFGSRNVYDHLLEVGTKEGFSHPIFRNQYLPQEQDHSIKDLIVKVPCNLTELYNGCKKTMKYGKRVTEVNGQSCSYVIEQKEIQILPGMSKNTPIIYNEQGHNQPGYKQSKLIFQIEEIPQKCYKRNEIDLIYTANITLMQALNAESITITQLNGNIIQLHFDQIISPQTERKIQGKGMPIFKGQGRGDLLVRFDIEFPQQLTIENKVKIIQLLN